jgi:uncharacterized protein DUF2255
MSFSSADAGVMLAHGRGGKPMKALVLAAALLLASAAHAAAPFDWTHLADTQTIEVVSTDEDGGSRLTTIWIVVIENQAYIRTSGTTWGDNVEREGAVKLREVGGDRPVLAARVLSAAEVERVVAAFREKYGTTDAIMELFRFGETRVFRLVE